MKFSERWLREWVNPKTDIQTIAEGLTMAGLEIESLTAIGNDLDGILIGKILTAEQHPNADRLRVCSVSVGDDNAPLTIVCGAANARAGIKVAVAMIGAVLPGDFKIKPAKIRGVESAGMLCSTSEIGLTETSEGIMELPEDAPIGKAFNEYLQLPDHILDLKITPNRGDCLSILGIAREVGVINKIPLQQLNEQSVRETITDTFPVKVLAPADCPHYVGRVIRGINPHAITPIWLQERLRRGGIRSIHPVVDITNYVMLELGQPLHAFDLTTLSQAIIVRHSEKGEQVTLLDGQTVTLPEPVLVIADAEKILALAGVMGGAASAVSTATTDLFIESAFFNPAAVRTTLRRLSVQSDSAHRFERGVDPELAAKAIERATSLLLEIVGGQAGPVITVNHHDQINKPKNILLRRGRITRLLGVELDDATVSDILQRLGMQLQPHPDGWEVTPPSFRFDMAIEVDLIEELVRIYGYDNIPSHSLETKLCMLPVQEHQLTQTRIRQYWVAKGYAEAINYSFIDAEMAARIDPENSALALSNPISAELAVMRTSLWPGLLQAALYNLNRQQTRIRLFEIGVCFTDHKIKLQQQAKLAGIVIGSVSPEQWGVKSRSVDFFDVKGDLQGLLTLTGANGAFDFIATAHSALHPGRCAAVTRDGKNIGFIGELHPNLQQELGFPTPVYLFELALEAIAEAVIPAYAAPSKYPSIRRDLAFVVGEHVGYQEIQGKIASCAGEILKNVQLFDIYQGQGIPAGQKSIALGLTFQLASRTLIDAEVDQSIEKVINTLKQDFQAVLRV